MADDAREATLPVNPPLGEPQTFPDADRNGGKYWHTRPTYMYTAHCANCGEDLLRAMEAEYAGYGDDSGLQCEVDELSRCPGCEWPMSENDEQVMRESADDDGMPDAYTAPLRAVYEFDQRPVAQ